MAEHIVENYLRERVKETGGVIRKVTFPGHRGAPDRLCGWEMTRRHSWIETKRPKGKAEAHQLREHERLRAIGFEVDVIDTKEKVDAFIARMSR